VASGIAVPSHDRRDINLKRTLGLWGGALDAGHPFA
jgi:hypothetical protein